MKFLMVVPYDGDISIYPAIYQCARILQENGHEITLVTSTTINDFKIRSYFSEIISKPYFKHRNIVGLFVNSLMFSRETLKLRPENVIVYEHRGMESIMFVPFFRREAKYIYFNLEILAPRSKINWKYRLRKKIELEFFKKCSLFTIQDTGRAEISKKYGIFKIPTVYIPNTYIFEDIMPSAPLHNPTRLLYSGALEYWSLNNLFCELDKLKRLDITFAGWSKENFIEDRAALLNEYPNLSVKLQQLNEKEFDEFVNSYDIGFIYYSEIENENIRQIGLSSGKFFKFLSLGKPVLVPRLPGIADEVEKNGLGIVYDDLNEIEDAVNQIVQNYGEYHSHILKVYKEKYDYRKLIEGFVESVANL